MLKFIEYLHKIVSECLKELFSLVIELYLRNIFRMEELCLLKESKLQKYNRMACERNCLVSDKETKGKKLE